MKKRQQQKNNRNKSAKSHSGSRHGVTRDGRRRVSYIEEEETYEKLVALTQKHRLDSVSLLIRQAIHEYVKKHENAGRIIIEGE